MQKKIISKNKKVVDFDPVVKTRSTNKIRASKNKKASFYYGVEKGILQRISRIEGQINGIRKMVGTERQCTDIIQQIMAVREALATLGMELLKEDFVCQWNKGGKKKEIDQKYLKSLFKIKN